MRKNHPGPKSCLLGIKINNYKIPCLPHD
eukprot:UN17070